MKKRATQTIIVIGVIALLASVSGTAMAWGPGSGCGKGFNRDFCRNAGPGDGDRWAELDKDQQAQLKDLHQKFIDETADARASIIAKFNAARILMGTSEPDRTKLVTLSNEISELSKTVMEKRIDFALAAKKIAPDFRFPLESRGEGRFHGMGMGDRDKDDICDNCPRARGFKGSGRNFCQNQGAIVPGAQGCQGVAAGCPGLSQTE
ncbi:MAG: periplasmic heavy metal sensor [Pseudomonadota bacterium]